MALSKFVCPNIDPDHDNISKGALDSSSLASGFSISNSDMTNHHCRWIVVRLLGQRERKGKIGIGHGYRVWTFERDRGLTGILFRQSRMRMKAAAKAGRVARSEWRGKVFLFSEVRLIGGKAMMDGWIVRWRVECRPWRTRFTTIIIPWVYINWRTTFWKLLFREYYWRLPWNNNIIHTVVCLFVCLFLCFFLSHF